MEEKVSKEIDDLERRRREAGLTKDRDQLDLRIKEATTHLDQCTDQLDQLCRTGQVNSRKCSNFLKQQEKLISRKSELVEKRKEVQAKLDQLAAEAAHGDIDQQVWPLTQFFSVSFL